MTFSNGSSIDPSDILTIQEAADLLNVSRSYFVKQILSKTHIRSHRFGKQRKIYREDVETYIKQRQIQTDEVMAKLADLSQELRILD